MQLGIEELAFAPKETPLVVTTKVIGLDAIVGPNSVNGS